MVKLSMGIKSNPAVCDVNQLLCDNIVHDVNYFMVTTNNNREPLCIRNHKQRDSWQDNKLLRFSIFHESLNNAPQIEQLKQEAEQPRRKHP